MHRKTNRRGQWAAIIAILASALGVIGFGGAFAAANAVTTPLSVTLNSCGTGNAAGFSPTGDLVLTANKTPGATECGTTYNTAGVGYADASVNGVAGTTMPAAAPTFVVTNDTQSDYVFDFEMTNGDRVWGFSNGTWTAFNGPTVLAPTGTYASVLAKVGTDTIKSALFFVSGDAAFPDTNVAVSKIQYANQTLGGGGAVTLTQPADVDNVLGSAITSIQLMATTNTSDTNLQYSATNLPAGLSIDKVKGVISGTPTNTGGSLVTVTATNDYGQSASQSFKVTVSAHAPVTPVPYVFGGQVVTVDSHNAVVGWSDSVKGWPSANHCVEVYIYGFDRPAGTAHVGFTCDNGNPAADLGYLRDLAPGHTYALFVQPATGVYGNNHPIPNTNPNAHITVITLRLAA